MAETDPLFVSFYPKKWEANLRVLSQENQQDGIQKCRVPNQHLYYKPTTLGMLNRQVFICKQCWHRSVCFCSLIRVYNVCKSSNLLIQILKWLNSFQILIWWRWWQKKLGKKFLLHWAVPRLNIPFNNISIMFSNSSQYMVFYQP